MAYLVSMTVRIAEIHRVLKPTGSFYLHCDPTASHYLKLVIDSIFCAKGGDFKNEIIWRRHYSHNDGNKFGCIHDVILYYVKSEKYVYNRQYVLYDAEYIKRNYSSIDPQTGKRFRSVSVNAAGQGEAKYFGDKLLAPPSGTHWRWSQERINDAIKDKVIYFTSNGVPRYKQFLDDMEGVAVQDTWIDFYSLSSHDSERLGYPTQKPEALLERIIRASTNEGDIVLDAYCGCGTTVAVAQRLKRKWIGIDITYQSISLILKRLEEAYGKKVLDTVELNGIPRDIKAAYALAHKKDDRVRKEFEKWAVLTYSDNRAIINEKKGADHGIDGIAYMLTGKDENAQAIFSVKSGHIGNTMVRDFCHVVERENAAMGVFITMDEPTKPMIKEAKEMGTYINPLTHQHYPKMEIVTVQEIINGSRLNLPQGIEVTKKAERKENTNDNQLGLDF